MTPGHEESRPPLTPVLRDGLAALAEGTGRALDDPHMQELRAEVEALEAAFALIDGAERAPSEDPAAYGALVRRLGPDHD